MSFFTMLVVSLGKNGDGFPGGDVVGASKAAQHGLASHSWEEQPFSLPVAAVWFVEESGQQGRQVCKSPSAVPAVEAGSQVPRAELLSAHTSHPATVASSQ